MSDTHWITLGFTASNGKPVKCAIIFALQTLTIEERLGVDIFAPTSTRETNTMFIVGNTMDHESASLVPQIHIPML